MFGLFAKVKRIVILAVILAVSILVYFSCVENGNENQNSDAAFSGIETDKKIFSIMACTDDDTEASDVLLLAGVCRGFECELLLFTDSDWLDKNTALLGAVEDVCTIGMLLPREAYGRTVKKAQALLGEINTDFVELTNEYPRFCTTEGGFEADSALREAILSLGKLYVMPKSVFISENGDTIQHGSIVSLGTVNENTSYLTAELLAMAMSDGTKCVSVLMLYGYYGEVENE